ncbi:Fanconi anemia group B protein [Bufo gargarizans]|uniref:Fanconi anemia group B protein n=1 Tax=Bufo gargarizans TaxID=30331 RepID=UPI001CF50B89|nr:Fanconi anemia group B protein [Bufo gargarizans]
MEVLCNSDHVLAYNGQMVTFHLLRRKNIADPAKKNVLTFSRKAFNAETGQFIEISGGEYIIQSSKSTLELVRVRCVADARTGIKLPCVLLRTCKRKSGDSWRLISLLLHPSNELETCLKFKVDSETIEDLYITDGPTILWRQQEKLHHVSSLTSEVFTAPIDISAVLWAGTTEEGTCILGVTTVRLDGGRLTGSSLPNRSLQGKEFVLYCIENQTAVPGSCLAPHAYSSVLRCLEVCTMQNVNGRYETSAIAASSKQLICFHNGVPKQVCQLPSENLSKLQLASTSRADILCVLSFSSGDACGIWKDGWKTAATWQHVRNILVDDFVGRGSDQVLLLFHDDPSNSSKHGPFRLTDCGDINYPVDHMDDDPVGFQENRLLMLQTLEARLQANLLSLEELQRHMQVQDRVIESSCNALMDMSLGREASVRSAEKEGLVSLWDDVENCHFPPATNDPPPVDSEQLVETIWQRVVDDLLVVGVKLKPSVPETLRDIGLSLIMDEKGASPSPVTKCQTNVLKLAIGSSQDSSSTCHAAKRQRLDYPGKDNCSGNRSQRPCPSSYQNDLEHTVTAVTELSSMLAFNNTACALLLHARRKTQADCLLRSEKLIVPCGSISLSLEDVLKGKHTINVFEHCQGSWSLEDIFAVLSAFQKCSLHLLSQDFTLTSVTEWMRTHMLGEPLKLIPEILVCKKDGSIYGTLLTWDPKTPCEGNLTVFYRNDSVLLQCLHSLKCLLPPTCVVNVMRQGDRNSMAMNLAQSLEEELFALRDLASTAASEVEMDLTLNCEAGKKVTSATDCTSDTREQVKKYRADLRAEQAQIRLGTHLSTSGDTYRRHVHSVAQIQMTSDAFVCKVANK